MNNIKNNFSLYEGTDPPPIITDGYKEVYDTYNSPYLNTFSTLINNFNLLSNSFNFLKDSSDVTISNPSSLALGAANLARDLVGTKYSWGGKTPNTGFDSLGLIQYVYKQNGISLPKSSKKLELIGTEVPSINDAQVGDIIYTSVSSKDRKHIKIVSKINNGQIFIIESKSKLEGVSEHPLTDFSDIVSIKRIVELPNNYIINYFLDKGLTRNQAKGIYGNLMQESGGNIKAISKDGNDSYGLAQWTGSRKEKLFSMYGSNPTAKQLLDFLWWELNNTHKDALASLRRTNTVSEATRVFMNEFERPHKDYANFSKRLKYANSII